MTSIVSIYRRFPTKESCLAHLEQVRWKDEPCCRGTDKAPVIGAVERDGRVKAKAVKKEEMTNAALPE